MTRNSPKAFKMKMSVLVTFITLTVGNSLDCTVVVGLTLPCDCCGATPSKLPCFPVISDLYRNRNLD
jgi:hypothetical protein